jgi:predicted Fe-S protein YdhL (DUF1289 family)
VEIAFRVAVLIFDHADEDLMPAIESPCSKICTLDPRSGLCLGCGRTLREIERWGDLTAPERARVINELPARLAAALGARPASPDVP